MVVGDAVKTVGLWCGELYLPHKVRHPLTPSAYDAYTHFQFKVAVAVPPSRGIDVSTNDFGVIVIVDEQPTTPQSIGGDLLNLVHPLERFLYARGVSPPPSTSATSLRPK